MMELLAKEPPYGSSVVEDGNFLKSTCTESLEMGEEPGYGKIKSWASSPSIPSHISQIYVPSLFNRASISWLISLHETRVGTGSPGLSLAVQTSCKHNSTPSTQ
jgi:hypothetical protein